MQKSEKKKKKKKKNTYGNKKSLLLLPTGTRPSREHKSTPIEQMRRGVGMLQTREAKIMKRSEVLSLSTLGIADIAAEVEKNECDTCCIPWCVI